MATRNQYIGEQDHLVHSPQNCKDKHADSRHCDIYPFNYTEFCKSSRIVTPSLICILTSLALEIQPQLLSYAFCKFMTLTTPTH